MTDSTPAPDSHELDSLLGAYALDALDSEDRARVDAYLERDATARAEVDDMRETAASLALLPDTPMDAPPELWARIEQAIGAPTRTGRPVPAAVTDDLEARRGRRIPVRWSVTIGIAAAAIAIVVLAAQVASLHSQLSRANSFGTSATAAAFDRAAKTPGAREVGLESGSGATLARVVLLPDGSGYLRGDDLTPLSPRQTYQLWALTGNAKAPNVVSAGLLGPDPSAVSFRASGPVHGFAVTIESAGGVVTSHHTPIASAQLS
ncbi:MAG: anti-sigma factor domain-containing protein [Acidimicrobiia bacterium]